MRRGGESGKWEESGIVGGVRGSGMDGEGEREQRM